MNLVGSGNLPPGRIIASSSVCLSTRSKSPERVDVFLAYKKRKRVTNRYFATIYRKINMARKNLENRRSQAGANFLQDAKIGFFSGLIAQFGFFSRDYFFSGARFSPLKHF